MHWVDILVIIFLIIVVIGGVKDGAIKSFFSLLTTVIAIPLAGVSYGIIAGVLSFLPGENWENFFGFCLTLGIISAIIGLLLLIPRKILKKLWRKGCAFRVVGGVLNLLNSLIGFAAFTLVLLAYPFWTWLAEIVSSSGILMWLAESWGFVGAMLPETLRHAPQMLQFFGG